MPNSTIKIYVAPHLCAVFSYVLKIPASDNMRQKSLHSVDVESKDGDVSELRRSLQINQDRPKEDSSTAFPRQH